MKIKLGIIFGGRSVEHEISIITANQTMNNIDKEKYEIVPIYISKQGLMYTGDKLLELNSYKDLEKLVKELTQVTIVNDSKSINIVRYPMKKIGKNVINTIDVAFPTMHGTNGEDGAIAGYLEMQNIPYIGSDILSSSIGMDKIMTRRILKESNIPSLDFVAFCSLDYINDESEIIKKIEKKLKYPVIVKAGNLGSSIGIKRASNNTELTDAIDYAMQYSDRIIVEKAITNLKEINCSVMGDISKVEVSECEEPTMLDEILSYQDKYMNNSKIDNSVKKKLPADISKQVKKTIQSLAVKTFKLLGCSGVARIDFLIDKDTDTIYVNEINTIPGALSYYLWEAKGKTLKKEIDELVDIALKRKREKERLIFSYEQNILSLNGKKINIKK